MLVGSAALALPLHAAGRAPAPAAAAGPAAAAVPEAAAEPGYRLLLPGTKTIAGGTTPGYNAYPGFCKMANGRRLVVARRAIDHSTDGGRAWKYVVEPDDTVSGAAMLNTLIAPSTNHVDSGLLTCDTGRVVCTYVINEKHDATSRVARIYSDDHGVTWSSPALIPNGYTPRSGGVAWSFLSSNPIQLPDGELRLALYGSDVDASEIWYVRLVRSADRGQTWSDMGVAIALPGGESAAEPNLAQLPDGRLFMAIRAGDLPAAAPQRILGCWSPDRGATWSLPVEVLADANARPSVFMTPDGDMLITNRGGSGAEAPPQGFLALSTDGGLTFPDSGRQQLSAARDRFVYASAIYDGPPGTDGALQIVAGHQVLGGANLYLYKLTRRKASTAFYDSAVLDTDGLVAYWPLTDTSGQQARDLKGTNHGALIGDVRLQRSSALLLPGAVLDTADDPAHKFAYVKVPHAPALNMAGAMTIECWAAPTPVNGTALVVKGGPYNFRFELLAGRMLFAVTADDYVLSAARVVAGEPHMFAVTWDGASVRFYLDGAWDGVARSYALAQRATTAPLWIGTASNGTAAASLAGPIAAVALYGAALDGDVIAAHHATAAG